jgi:tetratricopeptide (TPR) repeat protein
VYALNFIQYRFFTRPTLTLKKKWLLFAFLLITGTFAYNRIARFDINSRPEESIQLVLEGDSRFYRGEPLKAVEKYKEAWKIAQPTEAAVALATVYYFIQEKEEAEKWFAAVPFTETTRQWKTDFQRLLGQSSPREWKSNRPLVGCHSPSHANATGPILLLSILDKPNSEAHLARAGDLSPDCDEVQWMTTEYIMQSRGIAEALEFVSSELHKHPTAPGFLAAKGQLLILNGEIDSGKVALHNAIRANSRNPRPYLLLARLEKQERNRPKRKDEYQRKRTYEITLAPFEMYTKLAPYDPFGYLLVGNEYFEIRDLGAAAKNYRKALSLSPNLPEVNLKLAKISHLGGDLKAALKYIEAELKLKPDSNEANKFREDLLRPNIKLDDRHKP